VDLAAAVGLAVGSLVVGFALGLIFARRAHSVELDWRLRIKRRDAPAEKGQDIDPG
jgi:hypothetical protein